MCVLRIYGVMLEVIREVSPLIEVIRRRNPNLADQADRSLCSAPLNLREGNFALGKNRRAKYSIALSEWAEAIACFEVAQARGIAEPMDERLADRFQHVLATLINLVK